MIEAILEVLRRGIVIEIRLAGRELSREFWAECEHCGWKKSYPTERQAKTALSGHLTHCQKYGNGYPDWLEHPEGEYTEDESGS